MVVHPMLRLRILTSPTVSLALHYSTHQYTTVYIFIATREAPTHPQPRGLNVTASGPQRRSFIIETHADSLSLAALVSKPQPHSLSLAASSAQPQARSVADSALHPASKPRPHYLSLAASASINYNTRGGHPRAAQQQLRPTHSGGILRQGD
jgi:hypothetical protein